MHILRKTLVIALLAPCLRGSLSGQTVKENVLHALAQFNLQNSIVVVSAEKNHIEALPAGDGTDQLGFDLRNDRKRWKRNWGICTRIEHPGGIESWRARRKFSLHVTTHRADNGSLYYEMHIDHWAPSFWNPPSSFFHCFGEYVPHKLFGEHTNQTTVARGLAREDSRVRREHHRY